MSVRMKLGNVFALAFLLTLSVFTLSASADLKEGLVGSWRFAQSDGKTVKDGSANGNPGVIFTGSIEGSPGALRCDGSNTFVEVKEQAPINCRTGMTLLAWIRPAITRGHVIMGKSPNQPTWRSPCGLAFIDPGVIQFAGNDAKAGRRLFFQSSTKLDADAWMMVAMTWCDSAAKIYVNGKEDGRTEAPSGVRFPQGPFYIGCALPGFDMFKGLIGEVRIYNRGLSAAEIEQYYQSTCSVYPQKRIPPKLTEELPRVSGKVSVWDPSWIQFPTRTLASLAGYKTSGTTTALDEYGGWAEAGHQENATGFFYTKKTGERWWLIDPRGNRFLNAGVAGVVCIYPKPPHESFQKKYKSKENWARVTQDFLRDNGFNGVGAFSEYNLLRAATNRVPYTILVSFENRFTQSKNFFQDCVLPIFNEDFPTFCSSNAVANLAATKNDPWLIGTYSDNELQAPMIEKYLKLNPNDPVQGPNYQAAKSWLAKRKGKENVSVADITNKDRLDFVEYAFDYYHRVASEAIRKVDPNHLYLGSRFMAPVFGYPQVFRAAGKYCDVVSVNYYYVWGPIREQLKTWTEWSGRPILIGEFYAKGDDLGYSNGGGGGWMVKTQRDRGLYYQHYALGCLEAGNVVGWHWFMYGDEEAKQQDPKKPEVFQCDNKGIMNRKNEPYQETLNLMHQINHEIYPLTRFFDGESPAPAQVSLGGEVGAAADAALKRFCSPPFDSLAWLRADLTGEKVSEFDGQRGHLLHRPFKNFSGDISGRFIEIMALNSRGSLNVHPMLKDLLAEVQKHQRAGGYFAASGTIDWARPIDSTVTNWGVMMPALWGNARLLCGLMEATRAFNDASLLATAKRLGDFYLGSLPRFTDPARMSEYTGSDTYAAGYVTCYFPAMEGLVKLHSLTGERTYLEAAAKMAEFYRCFDRLPIDHTHGMLCNQVAILLLYEATKEAKYLERVEKRWDELVISGYVNPAGGVLEKCRIKFDRDEGCALADWLRLNLSLGRVTGNLRYYAMAERIVRNHLLQNQTPSGGFGHRLTLCDDAGLSGFQEKFVEATWCCDFHGPLGFQILRGHLVVPSASALTCLFTLDFTSSGADGTVTSQIERTGGTDEVLRQRIRLGGMPAKTVRVRKPLWADIVTAVDAAGKKLPLEAKDGFLATVKPVTEVVFIYAGGVYAENRHCLRLANGPVAGEPFVLGYGPTLLAVPGKQRLTVPSWPVTLDVLKTLGCVPLSGDMRRKECCFICTIDIRRP